MAADDNGCLLSRLKGALKKREEQKRSEGDLEEAAHISQLRKKFKAARENKPVTVPEKVEVAPISVLRNKFEEAEARRDVRGQPRPESVQQNVEVDERKEPDSSASSSDANSEDFCGDEYEEKSDKSPKLDGSGESDGDSPETKPEHLGRYVPEPREEVRLSQKIAKRMKPPPLVVHTAGKSIRKWETVSSLPWNQRFRYFLSCRGIEKATDVQSVVWSSVSRLCSVLAVAPHSQGKTLGWMLPILDSLHLGQYPDLSNGHSPLCIVLCAGVEVASSLQQTLSEIVDGADLRIVSFLCSSGAPEPQAAELFNGVDLLIATPARLITLLKARWINLERCHHLVLEDADTTLQVWPQEVNLITGTWKTSRAKKNSHDQIIAVAEKWSNRLKEFTQTFITKSFNPMIVFASPLEAVVYGELPMTIDYCESEDDTDKKRKLAAVILENDQSRGLRVIICCRDSRTADMVQLYVRELGKKCLVVNTESEAFHIHETLADKNNSVIAVSDPVLPCLQLSSAGRGTVLIHWDLPKDSKKYFLLRLQFVTDGLKNILTGFRSQPGLVHFFLSSVETQPALNTLLPFLQRCQLNIPGPLEKSYEEMREKKAQQGSLCLEMVELGSCRHQQTGKCAGRHQVHWRLDRPTHLDLQHEVVKFTILQMDSPVRYWVRLEQQDTIFTRLTLKMSSHFAKSGSRRPLESVSLDTVIAVADEECVYQRARVVELITKMMGQEGAEQEQIVKVNVFLIDKGLEKMVELSDLACLPAELALTEFPPCATRLVVSGAVPGDRDTHWGVATKISLLSAMELERQQERDFICRGRVILHLLDLLVVDRCQVMELQPGLGKFVCKVETVDFLTNQLDGVADKTPLRKLSDQAQQAGIFRPRSDETVDTEDTPATVAKSKATRAFLPLEETVLVKMTECLNPENFYLALEKNWKLVSSLENDLKKYIEEEGNKRRFREQLDQFVAVKDEDVYKRAEVVGRIRKVLSGKDEVEAAEPMISEDYQVMLVDEGILCEVSSLHVFRVKSDFFTRLPFQAVNCRLAGVRPAEGDRWTVEAGDLLFNETRTEEEDWPLVLYCTAISKDSDGIFSVILRSGANLLPETPVEENDQNHWRCGSNLAGILIENNLAISTETSDSFEASDEMLNEILNEEAIEKIMKPSLPIPVSPTATASLPPLPPSTPSLPSLPPTPQSLVSSHPNQAALGCSAPTPSQNSGDNAGSNNNNDGGSPQSEKLVQKNLNIYWSQTKDCVRLNVKLFTAMELALDQVHIRCDGRTFSLQVMEQLENVTILHESSVLDLQCPVIARKTDLKLVSGGLQIKLFKKEDKEWDKLSLSKCHWIKFDPEFLDELNEDDVLDQGVANGPPTVETREDEFKPKVKCEFELDSEVESDNYSTDTEEDD